MTSQNLTIPAGSLILVTGVNGFVGSHVALQFLSLGYSVRGTVRDPSKAPWLTTSLFASHIATGAFQLIRVADFTLPHAWDEALKGVAAIAHVASSTSNDPDPNKVITPMVEGVTNLLEAATMEASVREFVYTSSIVAATVPAPGNTTRVGRGTWNEGVLEGAWKAGPYEVERGGVVYAASKVAAEKAVWAFVERSKPHFTVNAVLPPMILGESLHRSHAEGKAAWVRMLLEGETKVLESMPGTITVDVKDVALLHVAAVLDPEVRNARLNAWGRFCTYNDMLAIMRKVLPGRKIIDDMPGLTMLSLEADTTREVALLEKWGGQEGFVPLEKTVEENLRKLVEWGY